MPARRRKKPRHGLAHHALPCRVIGGSLAIQKAPGGGTAVVCTVPLPGRGGHPAAAAPTNALKESLEYENPKIKNQRAQAGRREKKSSSWMTIP